MLMEQLAEIWDAQETLLIADGKIQTVDIRTVSQTDIIDYNIIVLLPDHYASFIDYIYELDIILEQFSYVNSNRDNVNNVLVSKLQVETNRFIKSIQS